MFRALSFDYHKEVLTKLRRVCGARRDITRTTDNRTPTLCQDNRKETFAVFGVSTWSDTTDQHPQTLCDKCARKIRHYKAQTQEYKGTCKEQIDWAKHQRSGNCLICDKFQDSSRPGRPKKCKRRIETSSCPTPSLPFSIHNTSNIFTDIVSNSSQSDPYFEILGR